MTSVSVTVIAALPSAPTGNAPVAVSLPNDSPPAAETATRPAADLPALALVPSPAPAARIEIEQARSAPPPQISAPPKTVAAPPEPPAPLPAQQEPAPEVTANTPAHAEKTVLAKLGLAGLREAIWDELNPAQREHFTQAEKQYQLKYPPISMDRLAIHGQPAGTLTAQK